MFDPAGFLAVFEAHGLATRAVRTQVPGDMGFIVGFVQPDEVLFGDSVQTAQFAIEYTTARLHAQDAAPHAVVAHSLAANAAAHAASRGLATGRLVLLAPPASPHEYTRLFAQVFGLTERTRAAMQRRIEAREGILMRQFEPPAVGPRITLPTLVVHDRGDRINRFADGEAYRDHIPGATLLATEGLGHRKILQQVEVLQSVVDFVAS